MGANLGCASPLDMDSKVQTGYDMDCNDYYSEKSRDQIKEWLNDLSLSQYYNNFIQNGFDKMDIIKANFINNTAMLETIGIAKLGHQIVIIKSIEKLNGEEHHIHATYEAYNDNDPLLNTNKATTSSELQFPVIDINKATTWKCDECYNINSDQISVCLKCGEKNDKNDINKKWIKKGVNV